MMRKLTFLVIAVLVTQVVFGQKDELWKEGVYYDKEGNSTEGLIYYVVAQKPLFKFRKDANSKEVKIKASDVIGFQIGRTKYKTINNFEKDSKEIDHVTIPFDFVEVIEAGDLNLYKHAGKVYHGRSHSETRGGSLGAGSTNVVETYLIREKKTGAIRTIYSRPEIMKEQLLQIFQYDEVLLFRISQGEIQYSDIPELVRNHNFRFE